MNKFERVLAGVVIAFPVTIVAARYGQQVLQADWPGLLPMLPAVLMGVMGFEFMRRQDEMHKRIMLEAAAFACTVTFAVALTWLLLESHFTLPSPAAITVIALLAGSWFAGLGLSWRRYS